MVTKNKILIGAIIMITVVIFVGGCLTNDGCNDESNGEDVISNVNQSPENTTLNITHSTEPVIKNLEEAVDLVKEKHLEVSGMAEENITVLEILDGWNLTFWNSSNDCENQCWLKHHFPFVVYENGTVIESECYKTIELIPPKHEIQIDLKENESFLIRDGQIAEGNVFGYDATFEYMNSYMLSQDHVYFYLFSMDSKYKPYLKDGYISLIPLEVRNAITHIFRDNSIYLYGAKITTENDTQWRLDNEIESKINGEVITHKYRYKIEYDGKHLNVYRYHPLPKPVHVLKVISNLKKEYIIEIDPSTIPCPTSVCGYMYEPITLEETERYRWNTLEVLIRPYSWVLNDSDVASSFGIWNTSILYIEVYKGKTLGRGSVYPLDLYINESETKNVSYARHNITVNYISSHPKHVFEVIIDGKKDRFEIDVATETVMLNDIGRGKTCYKSGKYRDCYYGWQKEDLIFFVGPVIKEYDETWNTTNLFFSIN